MTALDRLLGTWDITMDHVAMPEPVHGRQRFERTLGGAFILHTTSARHPDVPDAMGLFSETKCYYFDVRGIVRIFDVDLDERGMTLVFLDDTFSQRQAFTFSRPDTMECMGDASQDRGATWQHDFRVTFQRVDGGATTP